MIAGIRGRLVSGSWARSELRALPGALPPPAASVRLLEAWSRQRESILGPSSSVRTICDAAVVPLLTLLGYVVPERVDRPGHTVLHAAGGSVVLPVVVAPWNASLDSVWHDIVREGIRSDARWCVCCNGTALRIVDAQHTWTRAYLEFELSLLSADDASLFVFWNVMRLDAMAARPPLLDVAAEHSTRHGATVCRALGTGVLDALARILGALSARRSARAPRVLFEQSLTVLYRVLFLLFAEARALVPIWHPVYRERYTIDAIVTTLLEGRRYRGIWDAISAISRLAHAGCRTGELTVTAFNGRLFSPAHSSAFDERRISDEVMSGAVIAVGSTSAAGGGRTRIAYGDLDVEQLGAVYERVLEYEPATAGPAVLTRSRDARQSSGTFYTPRSVTALLVRQTLEPLVRDRTADDILRLRVVDPAMGSGAFLVGACRFLAEAAEQSLIREGRWHAGEIAPEERAGLRREIAQRCLFGVDVNPMAVQLARLSLWLATLAADKPLTFLDHHLVAGDSLVGAAIDDVRRQPVGGQGPRRRPASLPLFSDVDPAPALQRAVGTRLRLAVTPDDTAAVVADKTRTLAALQAPRSPLGRWWSVLNLWCSGWFWDATARPSHGVFADLCDRLLQRHATLPDRTADRLLDHAAQLASRHRFFHWTLAFPEVFCDEHGDPRTDPGFDAIVGNPPWDMLRGDSGEAAIRADRRAHARLLTDFVREAGVYRIDSRSHVNRYQLFVERALQLTRAGGRIGLVLPSGIATDTGAAPLRRHLVEHADVDSITGLDNRGGFFAIHRSLRFVLLTATTGRPTDSISCRFGVSTLEELDAERQPVVVSRRLLARLSGADDLGIPELATGRDLRIVEGIHARIRWLGAPAGWNAQFGRELNATDDRDAFARYSGRPTARPVLEGKHVQPFRVSVEQCRYELVEGRIRTRAAHRPRIAYRDIASATNRVTLIAAVIPARAVTTHTLLCLRTTLPADAQHVLCGLLNSLVANYLVRLRVNTHVTVSLVSRLPVPMVDSACAEFRRLAHLSRALAAGEDPAESMPEYAQLQALTAHLYGLDEKDLSHILTTFPIIPGEVKESILREFHGIH